MPPSFLSPLALMPLSLAADFTLSDYAIAGDKLFAS
jgi:hypothetical protein